jgi:hypothetical protein
MLLLLIVAVGYGQQGPDDATIDQMRGTVERLEGLASDANIPPQTREQLNELLFEKRGELHALLRQKRGALRASLRSDMTAKQANAIAGEIQRLDQQLRQLVKASNAAPAIQGAHSQMTGTANGSSQSQTIDAKSESTETVTVLPPAAPEAPVNTVAESPATRSVVTPVDSTAQSVTAPPPPAEVQAVTCPAVNVAGLTPAETEYVNQFQDTVCRIFTAKQPGAKTPSNAQLSIETNNMIIALALGRTKLEKIAVPAFTAQAEDASNAKNLSAGDSGSGSTSLVTKGAVPAILGFATEHGGLTRTADGTTVTFTGNPVGLVQAMAKKGFISAYQTQDDFTKFLRKLSFGLSFDTSRGDQAGIFTGNKQQLSGFTFRYNAVNHRDPRDIKYTSRWLEFTNAQASNLALSLNKFVIALSTGNGLPALNQWLASANLALAGKTSYAEIEAALRGQLNNLGEVDLPAEQEVLIEQVGTDFDAFIDKRNKILGEINNGWIATFDYTNTRPVGTPSLSNFRFVAEKGAYNGSVDFTGNASVTIYNSRPTGPNAKTLRDFRFAGQLDVPIGDITKTGIFLISLAGRYQRLLEDEAIAGSTLVVPKGDIATLQAKLTIPIRGTAFKIPLSFSYANRTELIKERELRGNFGFTFDLDSIFAKFNPFSQK